MEGGKTRVNLGLFRVAFGEVLCKVLKDGMRLCKG